MKVRLRTIRKELGMTQAEFGAATGKRRESITTYEIGKVVPDDTFILLLYEKWGYNPEWVKTGEGEKQAPKKYYEEGIDLAGKAMHGDIASARDFLEHFFDGLTDAEKLLFYYAMKKRFPKSSEKED